VLFDFMNNSKIHYDVERYFHETFEVLENAINNEAEVFYGIRFTINYFH